MLRQHADAPKSDPAAVRVAVDAARGRAHLLRRCFRADAADEEDFRQDLLLDLVRRSDRFDHSRSTWPAFARSITRNAAAKIARNRIRVAALTAPLEHAHDVVDERCRANTIELKIDLARALQNLPADLRWLASHIADSGDVASARRVAPISQAGFYRALQKLRARLITGGDPTQTIQSNQPHPEERCMHSTTKPVVPILRITELDFAGWLGQAEPKDTIEYHRGYLMIDTDPSMTTLSQADREELFNVAQRAWRFAQHGFIHLVQRRVGDEGFSYLAIRGEHSARHFISMASAEFGEAA